MADIIWGNVVNVESTEILVVNVTHQQDGNSSEYGPTEKINFKTPEIHIISDNASERNLDDIKQNLGGKFVKCEIKCRNNSGIIEANVFQSGQGGY